LLIGDCGLRRAGPTKIRASSNSGREKKGPKNFARRNARAKKKFWKKLLCIQLRQEEAGVNRREKERMREK